MDGEAVGLGPVPGEGQDPSRELRGLTATDVATLLGLRPHREGGYYRETYRSPVRSPTPVGNRSLSTSILYLLTVDDPSRFHRLRFDEVWFFHGGRPVEMVFLDPLETRVVGPGAPQTVVPGGRWMAARIAGGGTIAPGAGRGGDPAEGAPRGRGIGEAEFKAAGRPEGSPAPHGAWALVGCVVSPGFEYDDFEPGHADDLLRAHPEAADYIRVLAGD